MRWSMPASRAAFLGRRQRRETLAQKPLRRGQAHAGSTDPSGFDLVINATPMGMKDGDPLPVQADKLSAATFVGDVVTISRSRR
jgi:shikimate dehydrogenase